MTIEEMVQKCPGLVKVTPSVMDEVAIKIMGEPLDFNKTYGEMGFDDLDCVEMIMDLEKRLDIYITDEVADAFINGKSKPFNVSQYNRNKKIENLLNGSSERV